MRTGYSAIADEWIGIRPGTDGLFVLSLVHELLRADEIDLDYLGRYTNAAWLVIQAPGAADDGLFARNEAGEPLVLDRAGGARRARCRPGSRPRVVGEATLPDGRRAVPVFQLIAERYLDPHYAPEAVARDLRHPGRDASAGSPPRSRAPPSSRRSRSPLPWTDWAGRRHETMRGRPVSLHAMRGISAHSNGFQTCRALHLLQMLLGTIDVPGGWRYKSPYPKPAPPGPKPAGKPEQVAAGKPLAGAPLGYPLWPEDLIVDADGRPRPHRQGVLLGRADRRARPDAHGDPQRLEGRPVPDRHAVHVHGQHGLELGDEHRRDDAHADRQGPGDRRVPASRASSIPTPITPRRSPMPISSCPTRPISNAGTASRCSTGRSAGPTGRPMRSASRSSTPDRDVRPFQDVLIEIGARLGLPGFVDAGRRAALSRRLPGLHRQSRAHARASGRSPAGAAPTARARAGARRTRTSSSATSRTAASGNTSCRRSSSTSSTPTRPISKPPTAMGLIDSARADRAAALCRAAAALPPRGAGPWPGGAAGEAPRAHRDLFRPAAVLVRAVRGSARSTATRFPLHALTQRPMQMYHSWHSQNAWLRQILGQNRLFMNRATARALGLADEDWVWVSSHPAASRRRSS